METFADSSDYLIADVDCTADDGKPLCATHGVRGYPTLKWGDPLSLDTYKGGRDYDTLKKFVDENLKPICSAFNLDVCDEDSKKEIQKFQGMASGDLDKAIADAKAALTKAEKEFQEETRQLQEAFDQVKAGHSAKISKMSSVLMAAKAGAKDEL
jgi:hypothetical protein